MHAAMREHVRRQLGRHAQPTAGIIARQSVTTTGVGGLHGDDGGKQVNGRTRHIWVDPQGLLLKAIVHQASIMDRDGILLLLENIQVVFPRLRHLWVAAGYNGKGKGKHWVEETLGWTVAMVRHPAKLTQVGAPNDAVINGATLLPPPGVRVLPRRWVVERTCAWLSQNRRLSKDYARRCPTSEACMYVAMSRLMLRRLARR